MVWFLFVKLKFQIFHMFHHYTLIILFESVQRLIQILNPYSNETVFYVLFYNPSDMIKLRKIFWQQKNSVRSTRIKIPTQITHKR